MIYIKYKDYMKQREEPVKKWEGETKEGLKQKQEDVERMTEFHKGSGRSGGPF